jgi:hypothetical protein
MYRHIFRHQAGTPSAPAHVNEARMHDTLVKHGCPLFSVRKHIDRFAQANNNMTVSIQVGNNRNLLLRVSEDIGVDAC